MCCPTVASMSGVLIPAQHCWPHGFDWRVEFSRPENSAPCDAIDESLAIKIHSDQGREGSASRCEQVFALIEELKHLGILIVGAKAADEQVACYYDRS